MNNIKYVRKTNSIFNNRNLYCHDETKHIKIKKYFFFD